MCWSLQIVRTSASCRTFSNVNPAGSVRGKQVFYFQPIMEPFFWKESLSWGWDGFSCPVSPLAAESLHEWGFYGISIHGWKGNSFLPFAPSFSLTGMLLGDFLEKEENHFWVTAQDSSLAVRNPWHAPFPVLWLGRPLSSWKRQSGLDRRKGLTQSAKTAFGLFHGEWIFLVPKHHDTLNAAIPGPHLFLWLPRGPLPGIVHTAGISIKQNRLVFLPSTPKF